MDPVPDIGDFAEFAESLSERAQTGRIVRHTWQTIPHRAPADVLNELNAVSRALDGTLDSLDRAAEELRAQNEALFSARTELEGASMLFRDLFEHAPAPYLVTTVDTRIIFANRAACALLQRSKNALAGKPLICYVPLEQRAAFRDAVVRAATNSTIDEWSAPLLPSDGRTTMMCRVRIRPVSSLGADMRRALFWIITEETDEDLF